MVDGEMAKASTKRVAPPRSPPSIKPSRWAGTIQGHPLYPDANRRGARVILSGLKSGVVGVDRDYLFVPRSTSGCKVHAKSGKKVTRGPGNKGVTLTEKKRGVRRGKTQGHVCKEEGW